MAPYALHLAGDNDADRLLSDDPLALLIGMVLDQQIPLEWAFKGPLLLQERLGRPLDASELADMEPEAVAAVFAERPSLHRYPSSMAARVQALCQLLVARYDGDAAAVWTSAADGAQVLANVRALPGFGEQKARIFVALLGKQLGVRPQGWQKAAGPFGEKDTRRSIADIVDSATLAQVRAYKQEMKAARKAEAARAEGSPPTPAVKKAPVASPTEAAGAKKRAPSKKAASTKTVATKAAPKKRAAAKKPAPKKGAPTKAAAARRSTA